MLAVLGPIVEVFHGRGEGLRGAVEDWALGAGFELVAKGDEFDVVEHLGAFALGDLLEDVEFVVEVHDEEAVAGLEQGDEGAGLAGHGVAG